MSSVLMRCYRWTPFLLLPLATGCLVVDDRCGENQVEFSKGAFGACECAEGTVPSADNLKCEPCSGAFEVATMGMCQCMPGYSKTAGVCALVVDSGAPPADSGSTGRLTGTTGQDMMCTSSASCTGDATFCMTLGAQPMCLVQNCGVGGTRSCAADRVCRDISSLSSLLPALATTNGLCLPAAGCTMANGKVVTP